MMPNVIGIGAEKSGSTWLYTLLKSHPDIYMSERRKEIDFFNKNYDKGLSWYESFFPKNRISKKISVIGEYSPSYLYFPECAERIAKIKSIKKLLLIVRNPVDQMYSYYGQAIRVINYQKSFEDFLQENPEILERGFNSMHIKPFLKLYDRERILCLGFEDAIKNVEQTKQKIANFLCLNPESFPTNAGKKKENSSYIPKYKKLNYLAGQFRKVLIKQEQDWLINLAKSAGVMKFLRRGSIEKLPPMNHETREKLLDYYGQDIEEFAKMFNLKPE
ncbi:MAG: sulfotransferase domain-containing protein [Cyanobacteria bacterium P01_H01_bin.21]